MYKAVAEAATLGLVYHISSDYIPFKEKHQNAISQRAATLYKQASSIQAEFNTFLRKTDENFFFAIKSFSDLYDKKERKFKVRDVDVQEFLDGIWGGSAPLPENIYLELDNELLELMNIENDSEVDDNYRILSTAKLNSITDFNMKYGEKSIVHSSLALLARLGPLVEEYEASFGLQLRRVMTQLVNIFISDVVGPAECLYESVSKYSVITGVYLTMCALSYRLSKGSGSTEYNMLGLPRRSAARIAVQRFGFLYSIFLLSTDLIISDAIVNDVLAWRERSAPISATGIPLVSPGGTLRDPWSKERWLISCVVEPIAEQLLWLRLLLPRLLAIVNPGAAIFIVATVSAVCVRDDKYCLDTLNLSPMGAAELVFLSTLNLAYSYHLTGSIALPIVFHSLFNAALIALEMARREDVVLERTFPYSLLVYGKSVRIFSNTVPKVKVMKGGEDSAVNAIVSRAREVYNLVPAEGEGDGGGGVRDGSEFLDLYDFHFALVFALKRLRSQQLLQSELPSEAEKQLTASRSLGSSRKLSGFSSVVAEEVVPPLSLHARAPSVAQRLVPRMNEYRYGWHFDASLWAYRNLRSAELMGFAGGRTADALSITKTALRDYPTNPDQVDALLREVFYWEGVDRSLEGGAPESAGWDVEEFLDLIQDYFTRFV